MAKINIEDIDLQDIYEFMNSGDVNNAPEEVVLYLQLLDKTHGMIQRIRQFGTRQSVIKHLVLVDGLSSYKASLIYNETIEYFYRDENISKQAWRNLYASGLDQEINMARVLVKDVNDLEKISKMRERAAKLRQLDLVDPPQLPRELFDKPVKIYAMDAEFLGEEKINRLELARQIDDLDDLTPFEKEVLKQDAAISPIKLFPNEQEDLRKS
jgi:hypothetical protein